MEVNIVNKSDGGGIIAGVGMIAGIGLGLLAGAGVGAALNAALPVAETTIEKVVRWGTIAGLSTATQYVVSEAVVQDFAEVQDISNKALAMQQAKLAAKKLKSENQ